LVYIYSVPILMYSGEVWSITPNQPPEAATMSLQYIGGDVGITIAPLALSPLRVTYWYPSLP